jgi:inosose dehydratase
VSRDEERTSLRRPRSGEPLADSPIGVVPIIWNNVDLADHAPRVAAEEVLDEIARLGYAGTQLGLGFPKGSTLRAGLERRGLRLAEVYAALPCDRRGPTDAALDVGRRHLGELSAAGGEVLVVALDGDRERDSITGRAADGPTLDEGAMSRLGGVLELLAREAQEAGHRLAFHNHAATWIETPQELERLARATDPRLVELCLDVGHYIVGGGDPVDALHRYGERVVHVHLKDVAPEPLRVLREGRISTFSEALRARVFSPLGSGVLDLPGVLRALSARGYRGWLMVEQDTSWEPPSEAAAIGRRVLDAALRWLPQGAAEAAA